MPFTDKDGPLVLSAKQKREFSHWARPEEICREPKMLQNDSTDCYSIKQTVSTICFQTFTRIFKKYWLSYEITLWCLSL